MNCYGFNWLSSTKTKQENKLAAQNDLMKY